MSRIPQIVLLLLATGALVRSSCAQGFAREFDFSRDLSGSVETFDAEEVVALTVARNTASWGLMERLGMRRREDLDFENADFDAEDPTIIVYSIDPETWEHSR